MKEIYYLFLLVITALGSSAMTHYAPPMLVRIKRLFTRNKVDKHSMLANTNRIEIGVLKLRVDELEQQINNLAEKQATQDRNRKSNIRRDVREYLKELQND